MNSTRLRALAMKHLRWLLVVCTSQTIMLCLAVVSYISQEWLPLVVSLAAFSACLLSCLDHLSAFIRFQTLYRIQAEEESRWIR